MEHDSVNGRCMPRGDLIRSPRRRYDLDGQVLPRAGLSMCHSSLFGVLDDAVPLFRSTCYKPHKLYVSARRDTYTWARDGIGRVSRPLKCTRRSRLGPPAAPFAINESWDQLV